MSKKNTLTQEGNKRINPKLIPSYNDDKMSLSDYKACEERGIDPFYEPPFDANSMDDGDFDSLVGETHMDRYGREFQTMKVKHRRKKV